MSIFSFVSYMFIITFGIILMMVTYKLWSDHSDITIILFLVSVAFLSHSRGHGTGLGIMSDFLLKSRYFRYCIMKLWLLLNSVSVLVASPDLLQLWRWGPLPPCCQVGHKARSPPRGTECPVLLGEGGLSTPIRPLSLPAWPLGVVLAPGVRRWSPYLWAVGRFVFSQTCSDITPVGWGCLWSGTGLTVASPLTVGEWWAQGRGSSAHLVSTSFRVPSGAVAPPHSLAVLAGAGGRVGSQGSNTDCWLGTGPVQGRGVATVCPVVLARAERLLSVSLLSCWASALLGFWLRQPAGFWALVYWFCLHALAFPGCQLLTSKSRIYEAKRHPGASPMQFSRPGPWPLPLHLSGLCVHIQAR